jgi:hypothetical protein
MTQTIWTNLNEPKNISCSIAYQNIDQVINVKKFKKKESIKKIKNIKKLHFTIGTKTYYLKRQILINVKNE